MRPAAAATLVIAVLVSGCTASDEPATAPTSTTSAAPTTTPTPNAGSTVSALRMIEGRDYDVVATLPEKVDGSKAYWTGISPDAMVYGAVTIDDPTADPQSMGLSTHSSLVLLDPASGEVTRISDGESRPVRTYVAGIDVDERWITWLEGQGANIATGTWTLYSYDRQSRQTRELARSGDPVVFKDSSLDYHERTRIVGDEVVIGTSAFDDAGGGNRVLSVPLDGSAPLRIVAKNATDVDADDDGLVYATTKPEGLARRDGPDESAETVYEGKPADWPALYADGVLVIPGGDDGDHDVTISVGDREPQVFGPFRRAISYVDLVDGWVTLVEDADGRAKEYAIDIATMKLYKVTDAQGGWDLMGHGFAQIRPFGVDAKGDATLIRLR